MSFTPTDEQVGALAQGSTTDANWQKLPEYARDLMTKWAREDVAKPALQEIIRAAQAEAWREGYRTCDQVWVETADLVTPDEERTNPQNPYRTSTGRTTA